MSRSFSILVVEMFVADGDGHYKRSSPTCDGRSVDGSAGTISPGVESRGMLSS
jgi:hypothetical protein